MQNHRKNWRRCTPRINDWWLNCAALALLAVPMFLMGCATAPQPVPPECPQIQVPPALRVEPPAPMFQRELQDRLSTWRIGLTPQRCTRGRAMTG